MPIVILITMEALRAVPNGIREAAYGVGATRWEVVRSHVLPYAAPGVFTGAILSLARAFGETAPLLLVGAVTGYLSTPTGRTPLEILQGQYTSLPTQIYAWAKLAGRGLAREHGRGYRRVARRHPRREHARDHPEEPL